MTIITPSIAEQSSRTSVAGLDPSCARPRLPAAFKRLGWSNLLAQFSEQIALSAAALTAVLMLNAGPSETGWLQSAQTLPFLLLSIPARIATTRWRTSPPGTGA